MNVIDYSLMRIPEHVIRKQILVNIRPTIHQALFQHYLRSRNNDLSKRRIANQRTSFSGLHFPAFRLNAEIYSVNLRIQSKCEKMRTKKIPNFYAVKSFQINLRKSFKISKSLDEK